MNGHLPLTTKPIWYCKHTEWSTERLRSTEMSAVCVDIPSSCSAYFVWDVLRNACRWSLGLNIDLCSLTVLMLRLWLKIHNISLYIKCSLVRQVCAYVSERASVCACVRACAKSKLYIVTSRSTHILLNNTLKTMMHFIIISDAAVATHETLHAN